MTHQRRKCKQCGIDIESKRGRQFCVGCAKERDRLSRLKYLKKYRKTTKGKVKRREYQNHWAKKNRQKELQRKKLRKKRLREKALRKLGGKCKRCGYNEFKVSLDIHHKDPARKKKSGNPDWMRVNFDDWDNLILLCRNCHHALHNKKWKL